MRTCVCVCLRRMDTTNTAETVATVATTVETDFFAALKEMQHGHQQASPTSNDDNTCLITNTPLTAFHVELSCGHRFNYSPLYQEVLRQKGRTGIYSYFEKIGPNQIKCPYCRSITNRLLPYLGNSPHPTIKRLVGVNAPAAMCMPGVPCAAPKCSANAFYEFGQRQYCYRHHQAAIKSANVPAKAKAKAKATHTDAAVVTPRCAAENQTGKNKGKRCKRNASEGTTLCKIHAKCNIVLMTTT